MGSSFIGSDPPGPLPISAGSIATISNKNYFSHNTHTHAHTAQTKELSCIRQALVKKIPARFERTIINARLQSKNPLKFWNALRWTGVRQEFNAMMDIPCTTAVFKRICTRASIRKKCIRWPSYLAGSCRYSRFDTESENHEKITDP